MAKAETNLRDLMGHVLQVMYMVFLGVLIAVFCGLGVDTFYSRPAEPEYPSYMAKDYTSEPVLTEQDQKDQAAYDLSYQDYEVKMKVYSRNASLILIGLAIVTLVLSLTVLVRWEVIANGVLLGGIFTMAYSIILGMATGDSKYRFILVTLGVAVTLVLGYIKFIRANESKVR